MKIALVIGDYNAVGGGAERWTDRHARRLLAAGHQVDLLARSFNKAPLSARCVQIPDPDGTEQPRLHFAEAAQQHLLQTNYDIIHDMGDGWHADVFMPHHGTRRGGFEQNSLLLPSLLRPLRSAAAKFLPRYREFAALEHKQYARPRQRYFLAVSGMVSRHMQQYYGVPGCQIRVIYNGVDTNLFAPASAERRQELRQQFGIDPETTLFLMVAHNFKLKGLDAVLAAMGMLRRQKQNVRLLVVGKGKTALYKRKAWWQGCHSAVQFVGNQADSIPYYQAADVFLQPTFYDPCSLVVLEALSCAVPVITTRANGVSELMRDGQEGFVLANPNDIESLADDMLTLLDPEMRHQASLAARQVALARSEEENFQQIIELYQTILESRRSVTRAA